MDDIKRSTALNGDSGLDLTAQPPRGRKDSHPAGKATLVEILESLKKENVRLDKFMAPGNEYEVETTLTINSREWCFSSLVKQNSQVVTDDLLLIKEDFCRKRVAETNKTKALWNLFVKEAAEIHLHKCQAVESRFERSKKHQWRHKHTFILGIIIIAVSCIGLYLLYPTPPPTEPTAVVPDRAATPPPAPGALTPGEPQPSVPTASVALSPEEPQPSAPTASVAQSPEEPQPSVPAASVALSPDHTEAPTVQPQKASDLSPEEIRERVSRVLKSQSKSP